MAEGTTQLWEQALRESRQARRTARTATTIVALALVFAGISALRASALPLRLPDSRVLAGFR